MCSWAFIEENSDLPLFPTCHIFYNTSSHIDTLLSTLFIYDTVPYLGKKKPPHSWWLETNVFGRVQEPLE